MLPDLLDDAQLRMSTDLQGAPHLLAATTDKLHAYGPATIGLTKSDEQGTKLRLLGVDLDAL